MDTGLTTIAEADIEKHRATAQSMITRLVVLEDASRDSATPLAGTLVLGLFAIAMGGVGVAIAGVFGTRFAGPAVVILVIVTWFLDILVPALNLPDVVHQLALTAHYGQPMVGQWDAVGIAASVLLGIAGVAIGAWGFRRRDLRG